MPTTIRILLDEHEVRAELGDGPTVQALIAALPFEETLRSFGDCFYVESPVTAALEPGASDEVSVGDVAYWPAALAVCCFFGPTPESAPGSSEPVAPSDVTIIGRLADPARLAEARDAKRIRIEKA